MEVAHERMLEQQRLFIMIQKKRAAMCYNKKCILSTPWKGILTMVWVIEKRRKIGSEAVG